MKPSLYILKQEVGKSFEESKINVYFVVVDADNPKDYPLNFVCLLPSSQGLISGHSTFNKVFGEDSMPLAKKLLHKALDRERDLEIKSRIGDRLNLLNPKAIVKARCRLCRSIFESKRHEVRYQTCPNCSIR